jgi:hypothetical protein
MGLDRYQRRRTPDVRDEGRVERQLVSEVRRRLPGRGDEPSREPDLCPHLPEIAVDLVVGVEVRIADLAGFGADAVRHPVPAIGLQHRRLEGDRQECTQRAHDPLRSGDHGLVIY